MTRAPRANSALIKSLERMARICLQAGAVDTAGASARRQVLCAHAGLIERRQRGTAFTERDAAAEISPASGKPEYAALEASSQP